jgi:hypothetical protein
MYRQVGAALLLPKRFANVMKQWPAISRLLAAKPRIQKQFALSS